jgi:AcrR family transcriptional regulator
MDTRPPTRKAAQSAVTRERLIGAARRLFARDGYAATGTEAILAELGITRGALYHQFRDKAALFEAVCVELHEEIVATILAAVAGARDPLDALERGSLAFLDYLARPEATRILVTDAPAVLGWARWNALDEAHGARLLREGLAAAVAAGRIEDQPLDELAVLLNGAINAGAMWVGAGDLDARLARMRRALRRLLDALRPGRAGPRRARAA